MEEFTRKNNSALDAEIILPAEKKITLQPLHADVAAGDESDVQIATSHANGTPIGNITSDRELTTLEHTEPAAQPAPQPQASALPKQPIAPAHTTRKTALGSVIIMAVIIAVLLFVLISF